MENDNLKTEVQKLIDAGVPEPKIAEFIQEYNGKKFQNYKETQKTDWKRIGYQTVGGMAGGAVGAATGGIGVPVGIGLGSSMAGQAYDIAQERLGNKEPITLGDRFKTAGYDFVLDTVVPEVITRGANIAKTGVSKVGSIALNKFRNPERYLNHVYFGTAPSLAEVTDSAATKRINAALSQYMFSAAPIEKLAQYNMSQLDEAAKILAKEYGPILSKEEMGVLLKSGAKSVVKNQDAVWGKLFTRVGKDIGTERIPIKNTASTLTTLVKESQTGPSSGIVNLAKDIAQKAKSPPTMMQQMAGQTNKNGLAWEDLKKFRTMVGDMMRSPELITTRNIQSGDLKRLYGALTQDMEEAAIKAGPKVHARWRAANKYFETKITRDLPIIESVIKKADPDEVFDWAISSAKKGGTRLRILKKQLNKSEFDAISGTVLGKLGMAPPGGQNALGETFSVRTFLTNWNKLQPGAKRVLFGDSKYSPLAKELDNFAKVVGDFKELDKYANKSNTGSVLAFFSVMSAIGGTTAGMATGSGIVGGLTGLATVALAPREIAKLITNKEFVRWAAKGINIAKYNTNAMPTHLGRLMVMRFDDELQPYVDNIIDKMLNNDKKQ